MKYVVSRVADRCAHTLTDDGVYDANDEDDIVNWWRTRCGYWNIARVEIGMNPIFLVILLGMDYA